MVMDRALQSINIRKKAILIGQMVQAAQLTQTAMYHSEPLIMWEI